MSFLIFVSIFHEMQKINMDYLLLFGNYNINILCGAFYSYFLYSDNFMWP